MVSPDAFCISTYIRSHEGGGADFDRSVNISTRPSPHGFSDLPMALNKQPQYDEPDLNFCFIFVALFCTAYL